MKRPYDLRHADVSRRRAEGIDPATVASWAGRSVETLMRIYVHVLPGQEDAHIAKMNAG